MSRITRSSGKEPETEREGETAVRSMCIVCGVDFTKFPQLRENENFPELWNKLWTAFCISLNLDPSSWTGISRFYSQIQEIPFCLAGDCRTEVVKLLVYRNQIEGVEEKISKIANNISMTIINTHTSIKPWKSHGSRETRNEDENTNIIFDLNVKKEIEKLRNRLTHRFIPKIILTNVELPEENSTDDDDEVQVINADCGGEEEMEDEVETDFIRDTSDESESEAELEPEPELQPELQSSSVPVNLNLNKNEDSDSIWMYQDKWPVKSLHQPGPKKPDSKTYFECLTCGRTRLGKGSITTHIRQDHIFPNKFVCSVCNHKSRDSSILQQHMSKIHGAKSVSSPTSTRVLRASTSASVSSPSIQGKSQRIPESNTFWLYMDKYPIIRLGSQFCQKNSRFKCGICDHSSATQTLAIRHVQRIHMSSEKFDCVVCGQNNADDWCLRTHMKIHGDSSSTKIQSRREIEATSSSSSESLNSQEEETQLIGTGSKLILVKGKWPVEPIGNLQNPDNKSMYKCKTCGFTGRGMHGITIHVNRMHDDHKKSIKSTLHKQMEEHGKTSSTGNNNKRERGFSTYLTRNQRRKTTSSEALNSNNNNQLVPY